MTPRSFSVKWAKLSLCILAFWSIPEAARPTIERVPQILVEEEGDGILRILVRGFIAQTPQAVWTVLTDCALATRFVPHLESCRIVERDPDGRWDVRENISNPPILPRVRTVVRNDFKVGRNYAFTYRLVSGDMRLSDGRWSLEAGDGGTLVLYEARIAPNVPAPLFLIRNAISHDFPEMFRRLGALSEARAR